MGAQRHALIVAGGSGSRLGGDVPKQYLPLAGIPVIVRTVQAFVQADASTRITVVVNADWMKHFSDLIQEWDLPNATQIVSGGANRFESVRNGLKALSSSSGFVAVHDAVRPLVSSELIRRVFVAAEQNGNAIPLLPVTDSLRRVASGRSEGVSRDSLYVAQTPQCFKVEELAQAYEQEFSAEFTDCASVMESSGHSILTIEGDESNIKLTTKSDLQFAQWYLTFG